MLEWAMVAYFIYYAILCITYKSAISQGTESSRSVNFVFSSSLFTFLIYSFNAFKSYVDPLKASSLTHMSLSGALHVYTLMIAYFFTPADLEGTKELNFGGNMDDENIIQDVSGAEMLEMAGDERREENSNGSDSGRKALGDLRVRVGAFRETEIGGEETIKKDEDLSDDEHYFG
eukprot:TRINITY_DN3101_c0_g1_i9.p1 TRINITY_DN3101_c0_g1~~TRINITY_DN3101_c0_g1_i9.p1  ORF type:complete len:175 (-),score=35.66 TRINITY_DN3101_c0_g1_i9:34-558(-)